MRKEGLSQRGMAERLNAENITAAQGGQWSLAQIQQVLKRLSAPGIDHRHRQGEAASDLTHFPGDKQSDAESAGDLRHAARIRTAKQLLARFELEHGANIFGSDHFDVWGLGDR